MVVVVESVVGMRKKAWARWQNLDELVDGNRGRDGEKLDQPEAKQNRQSNPTKLHHTNKSQKRKKLGLFLWGNFRVRTKKQHQARKQGEGAPKS